MCVMKGYTPKEFARLLIENGWRFNRKCGTHCTYIKDGNPYIVTYSEHGKELSRPLVKRLIKEANLRV